ncbi:MAG: histidine kinase, partial [Nitrosopumilus sp.]|nr:histidine kinase [Nitrosopumilus sp.]
MVYIRFKKVKSEQYLYLVKSVWDSKKKTSKQEIIKYLGKASLVVKDD